MKITFLEIVKVQCFFFGFYFFKNKKCFIGRHNNGSAEKLQILITVNYDDGSEPYDDLLDSCHHGLETMMDQQLTKCKAEYKLNLLEECSHSSLMNHLSKPTLVSLH